MQVFPSPCELQLFKPRQPQLASWICSVRAVAFAFELQASDGSEEQALKSPFEAAVRIKGLADTLRLNRIITALELFDRDICDEQLKALADAIRVNKTIKHVDLDRNQIGDEGVKALADAILVNKTIKEVVLSDNQIGNDGVKALADAFLVNKTIERVDLRHNQIGNEGVKALASAMEINETIMEVQHDMEEDSLQFVILSDEERQAVKDIQHFCDRNIKATKARILEAAVRNRQCPYGHDLRLEEVTSDEYCCRCDGSLSQGERVYRCGECDFNFDLCLKCLEIREDAPVGSIVPTNET
eukprot:symbB.v1.2.022765.t1/scaffold2039.1/size91522/3